MFLSFRRIWHIVRFPLGVIFVLFVGLVIYRIPVAIERAKTEEIVKKIQAQKLTLADVLGKRLPPEPDPRLKDATIAGIDANNNGIRDDVELAIFKLHPDSARIRAAELQYAMELQNELANVFNSETLVATIQEEGRGFGCIYKSSSTDQVFNIYKKEVKDLVFNTDSRKKKSDEIFNKYMTSFATLKIQDCDIESALLPN